MAINASGAISLGGCTVGQSIAKELGLSGSAQIALNCTNVRTLLGVASGQISMSSAYGKSSETIGQTEYTTAGSYCFVIPAGVTRVSAVVVGGGGGGGFTNNQTIAGLVGTAAGGGALAYVNSVTVTPGTSMAVVVGAGGLHAFSNGFRGNCTGTGTAGGQSSVSYCGTKAAANGGGAGSATSSSSSSGPGGTVATGQGGSGGRGGYSSDTTFATPSGQYKGQGGGGGAGGYSGTGGAGGDQIGQAQNTSALAASQAGAGGGGGGGSGGNHETGGGRGGGVGLLGQGSSGAARNGNGCCGISGFPGSSGVACVHGGGGSNTVGARGGVRIIYPGCKRSFPSTRTANE